LEEICPILTIVVSPIFQEHGYLKKGKFNARGCLRSIIEDGVASGEFRRVEPKMAVLAILGMCNWLVQWYNPEGEVSAQMIAEIYADYALRLVRP